MTAEAATAQAQPGAAKSPSCDGTSPRQHGAAGTAAAARRIYPEGCLPDARSAVGHRPGDQRQKQRPTGIGRPVERYARPIWSACRQHALGGTGRRWPWSRTRPSPMTPAACAMTP